MTTSILIQPEARTVIVGVDTHKHVHVAVAIDTRGICLGDQSFVADSGGYRALITWADTHGRIKAFGIEGTGSYGAGLARAVRRAGHRVVAVNRGDRHTRRAVGKSDPVDAESAARSVLAGQATAPPPPNRGRCRRDDPAAQDRAGYGRGLCHTWQRGPISRPCKPLDPSTVDSVFPQRSSPTLFSSITDFPSVCETSRTYLRSVGSL